jgi:hypothetical protein
MVVSQGFNCRMDIKDSTEHIARKMAETLFFREKYSNGTEDEYNKVIWHANRGMLVRAGDAFVLCREVADPYEGLERWLHAPGSHILWVDFLYAPDRITAQHIAGKTLDKFKDKQLVAFQRGRNSKIHTYNRQRWFKAMSHFLR